MCKNNIRIRKYGTRDEENLILNLWWLVSSLPKGTGFGRKNISAAMRRPLRDFEATFEKVLTIVQGIHAEQIFIKMSKNPS